jgi:beta-glucanase (GH16 family)
MKFIITKLFLILSVLALTVAGIFTAMDNKVLNDTFNNASIIPIYSNTPSPSPAVTVIPTPQVDEYQPAPGYLFFDDFSKENENWEKRSGTWTTSYVETTFVPSLVKLYNGKLVLQSYIDNHTGSEYQGQKAFTYGKYRASIRMDQVAGSYLTFYSYKMATGPDRQGHNEIDIEIIKEGGSSRIIFTNHHNGANTHYDYILPFDISKNYHVYGYDWYSDHIDYVVDGKVVWTSTTNIPDQPMCVYFQNWVMRDPPAIHGYGLSTEYVDWVTVEPL